jgi:hypothetical protein
MVLGVRVAGCLLSMLFAAAPCLAAVDIRFDDVSDTSGIAHASETYGASWGDLDGDGYPDLFVSNHRTQPSLFLNNGKWASGKGAFVDVAKQTPLWVNIPWMDTHGGTWFDVNNDGHEDLFVAKGRGFNPQQFFFNDGRGVLIDSTDAVGLGDYLAWGGRQAVWFDYDGDGRPDFILAQFAGPPALMHQRKDGTFVQTNKAANFACSPNEHMQLMDLNGNGKLDVVCPTLDLFPYRVYNPVPMPWQLLKNAMPQIPLVADDIIGDFDNDGRMDVFILSNVQLRPSGAQLAPDGLHLEARLMGQTKGIDFVSGGQLNVIASLIGYGAGKIYIGSQGVHPPTPPPDPNKGPPDVSVPFTLDPNDPSVIGLYPDDGTITPILRVGYDPATQRWTFIQRSANADGDNQWSEAYLQISSTDVMSGLHTSGMWGSDNAQRPTLLMNRPGGFVDETVQAGLGGKIQCASVTAGDFNNDMYLDLYLACRTATGNIENILFENQGDGTFLRVPGAGGAAGPVGMANLDGAGTADSVVTADYDMDGFLDLFVTNGLNLEPRRVGGPNKLFHNAGNGNHWIELDLVGTRGIREATGTVVKATANRVTQTRVKDGSHHRWSQNDTRMHFGLAQAQSVDLTIQWASGTVEVYPNVPVDKVYRATEGSGRLEVLTPGQALPYACGLSPEFNLTGAALSTALGPGAFLAKDCTTGAWLFRVVGGGTVPLKFTGTISSDKPFVPDGLKPRALESADTVDSTTDPKSIGFNLNVAGNDWDGFDFHPADGANTCFNLTLPANVNLFFGPARKAVRPEFDLESLKLCPGQPDSPLLVAEIDNSASADAGVTGNGTSGGSDQTSGGGGTSGGTGQTNSGGGTSAGTGVSNGNGDPTNKTTNSNGVGITNGSDGGNGSGSNIRVSGTGDANSSNTGSGGGVLDWPWLAGLLALVLRRGKREGYRLPLAHRRQSAPEDAAQE